MIQYVASLPAKRDKPSSPIFGLQLALVLAFTGKDATYWIMKFDRAMGDAGATFQARKDSFQDYVKPSIFPSIRNLQKIAKSYTDFLVRIQSKYKPWDSTTQANPSAEYEALHSKRVTLNYLDVPSEKEGREVGPRYPQRTD